MDRPEKANAVYELVYSRFQPGSWTPTAGSPRLDVPENENADMTQVVCQEAQSETGEGAPRLRAPAALPKDAVLIPSTCKVARSSLQLQSPGESDALFWARQVLGTHVAHRYMQNQTTAIITRTHK